MDPAPSPARTAVLVEGPSDAAVVRVLADARGLRHTDIVDMGGVTNIGHHLTRLSDERSPAGVPGLSDVGSGTRVAGLCDAGEAHVFLAALRRHGYRADTLTELGRCGFFVCTPDLEGELHRALGPELVMQALHGLGDCRRFRRFQQQPVWRDRPLSEQLHRFAGTSSGRKIRLAGHLATLLTPDNTPAPLASLLDFVAMNAGSSQAPSTAASRHAAMSSILLW